ncbi:hypothetical protein [Beijerinckia mobilis]|uniref:hypothetical protein n=1 Tax=Beijerinckia mobilis TaxID=231434 RepID=UPI0012EBC19B|nr:hypothetical protein [Beijerinckia mobilis]
MTQARLRGRGQLYHFPHVGMLKVTAAAARAAIHAGPIAIKGIATAFYLFKTISENQNDDRPGKAYEIQNQGGFK